MLNGLLRTTMAVLVLGSAVTAPRAAAAAVPLIASAQVSVDGTALVITGANFVVAPTGAEDPGGSPTPPTVSLALTALPVTASSATSATAASALRASNAAAGGTTGVGFEAFANHTAPGISVGFGSGVGRDQVSGRYNVYIGHPGLAIESGAIRIGVPNTHTQTHLSGTVTAPAFVGDASALTNVRAVYQ